MLADNEPGQDTYRRLLRPAHFLGPSPETRVWAAISY